MKIDEWSVDDANRKRAYKRDRKKEKKKKYFYCFYYFLIRVFWK